MNTTFSITDLVNALPKGNPDEEAWEVWLSARFGRSSGYLFRGPVSGLTGQVNLGKWQGQSGPGMETEVCYCRVGSTQVRTITVTNCDPPILRNGSNVNVNIK